MPIVAPKKPAPPAHTRHKGRTANVPTPPTKHVARPLGEALTLAEAERAIEVLVETTLLNASKETLRRLNKNVKSLIRNQAAANRSSLNALFKKLMHHRSRRTPAQEHATLADTLKKIMDAIPRQQTTDRKAGKTTS